MNSSHMYRETPSSSAPCHSITPHNSPKHFGRHHLKSFGQHFSFGQSFASCVAAWTSNCVRFVFTISLRQFAHYRGRESVSRIQGLNNRTRTYNRSGLGRFDWVAIRLLGCAGASSVGFLLFTMDLGGIRVGMKTRPHFRGHGSERDPLDPFLR